MGKRIFVAVLMLTLFLPLWIPVSVQAVQEETLEQSIQRQIENFASSLYSDTTPGASKSVLLRHAIFGGGKDLIVGNESQLTAAFMNSAVLQECVRYSCIDMIRLMQDMNLDILYGAGSANWYRSYCGYNMNAYLDVVLGKNYIDGECVDNVASSFDLYGKLQFDTPLNTCDEAMITVVGSCHLYMAIRRINVGTHSMMFEVSVIVYDDFDFDGSYDDAGLDMSLDKELAEVGGSLAGWLVKPFHWESTASFTLEVPYSCDHFYGNYQWTWDPNIGQLVNDTSYGYAENAASLISDGEAKFYRLDNPVQLRHDVPWSLEYDVSDAAFFSMGTVDSYETAAPFFDHWSNNLVLIGRYRKTLISESPKVEYANENYRYGTELAYDYEAGHTYSYRYENRIAEDGTNMIWVSVTDKTTGQQMVAPTPMNDFYMLTDDGMAYQNCKTDWLSGKDISICYIGSKSAYNIPSRCALRIWTNGEDGGEKKAFQDGYIQPTCTMPGGKAQVCQLCGYYELTEPVDALGHSFGEYVSNLDADCVNDGTKTAECKVCGVEDTVVDEGSVFGHEFRKYKSDANATCTSDGTKSAKCKYCDVVDTVPDPGTMLPHTYEAVTTPPTCTEAGFTTHSCICGDSYTDSYVEPLGHHFSDWQTTKEPNYLENGEKTRTCAGCELVEREGIHNNPFTDVAEDNKLKKEILWAYYSGITSGVTTTTFEPNTTVNRGQAVTFLWRAAGCPEPESDHNPFTDVGKGAYYYKAILWAVEQGITNGTTATTFSPQEPCKRRHIAMFLYRWAGEPEVAENVEPFPDVNSNNTFYKAVLWAAEEGITKGTSQGIFDLHSECTRAQVVTFLYRSMEK